MPGALRMAWELLCGNCFRRFTVTYGDVNRETAKRLAQSAGWVSDRRLGWLCPDCQKRLKEAEKP